jgi:hypothetical protein
MAASRPVRKTRKFDVHACLAGMNIKFTALLGSALAPQNAAFFTPKGAGAGRQTSENDKSKLEIFRNLHSNHFAAHGGDPVGVNHRFDNNLAAFDFLDAPAHFQFNI